ncbi:hemolysin-type calcium-binding region [Roseivivax marinus]|uniref:Hemolysin-type calcium-binding region n=1 Tax=Roseivivax marinus TaxID=1379903 RepID=W4HLB9_9RHOB|nr:Calx-beta domain-containing protein [Roseivivax marinus]ETW13223.1 hemolysin-type calcium-binding region [Roseivivax marinus]
MPIVTVAPTYNFEATSGQDPNYLNWTVSLSEASDEATAIGWSITGGTASVGTDVRGPDSGTLTIPAGQTAGRIFIRIDGDSVEETDEAVVLELYGLSNAEFEDGAPTLRTIGWVLDDDGSGTKRALFSPGQGVPEGDSGTREVEVDLFLSRAPDAPFDVVYRTLDGSAQEGSDVTGGSGTLTFAPGQTENGFSVGVLGDQAPEANESVEIFVGAPDAVASSSVGALRILDDDGVDGLPVLSISPVSNFEATSGQDPNYLIYSIALSEPSVDPVEVGFSFLGGTASVGEDVRGPTTGVRTIAPGATGTTAFIRIDGDSEEETDEAVILEVFANANAALPDGVGSIRMPGLVLDDDGDARDEIVLGQPVTLAEVASVTTEYAVPIRLSRPAEGELTLSIVLSGSGGPGLSLTDDTVTFAAGQQVSFARISVVGDETYSGDGARILSAFSTADGVVQFGEQRLTVIDAEEEPVELQVPATGTVEIDGVLRATQTLSVDASDVADANGLGPFSYQWLRGTTEIAGATGTSYTPVTADIGSILSVAVSFTDGLGQPETVTGAADGLIDLAPTTPGADVISGTPEGDRILGGDGNDTLDGAAGDDGLLGEAGDDSLVGGPGDDNIAGSDGNDVVDGGDGNDFLGGGLGNDMLLGGEGSDTLGGGQGDDALAGGTGDDVAAGGPGDDLIEGGAGDDTMGASFGADTVLGQGGDDSLGGGTGTDSIDGGAGNDSIGGGEGDDTVIGGAGNDFLAGGGRDDSIVGGPGNDTINGGAGDDTMVGGAGADLFVFNDFTPGDVDRVVGFEDGVDRFRMVGVENAPGSGLQGFVDALEISDAAGGGVTMSFNGHVIEVTGVSAADLGLEDFIFI